MNTFIRHKITNEQKDRLIHTDKNSIAKLLLHFSRRHYLPKNYRQTFFSFC